MFFAFFFFFLRQTRSFRATGVSGCAQRAFIRGCRRWSRTTVLGSTTPLYPLTRAWYFFCNMAEQVLENVAMANAILLLHLAPATSKNLLCMFMLSKILNLMVMQLHFLICKCLILNVSIGSMFCVSLVLWDNAEVSARGPNCETAGSKLLHQSGQAIHPWSETPTSRGTYAIREGGTQNLYRV